MIVSAVPLTVTPIVVLPDVVPVRPAVYVPPVFSDVPPTVVFSSVDVKMTSWPVIRLPLISRRISFSPDSAVPLATIVSGNAVSSDLVPSGLFLSPISTTLAVIPVSSVPFTFTLIVAVPAVVPFSVAV